MAYVSTPGRFGGRKGSRRAVGPQTNPAAKVGKKSFKTPGARVTEDDAVIRLAHHKETGSAYTTRTKSTKKRLRRDGKGKTTQTEFMPEKQKEHINKVMGNATAVVEEHLPQTRINIGPVVFAGSFSSGSHESNDYASPPKQNVNLFPPIDEFLEIQQTGKNTLDTLFKDQKNNTFRLENYGPMYATGEIDPEVDIGDVNLPLKSTSGFNRTGVFNPLAFYDWGEQASTAANSTSFEGGAQNSWAVGGKHGLTQGIAQVIRDWYKASDSAVVPSASTVIQDITEYCAGMSSTSSLSFPVTEINETYTFRNENSLTPVFLSLYHCVPKQRLGRRHNPITDWYDFQLGGGKNIPLTDTTAAAKADSELAFPPQFSQYANDFATISADSEGDAQVDSISVTKWPYVTTISTEVVPQNTPFQSQLFKNHWDVINNKKILLQPAQELNLHIKIKFKRPIDVREILLGDASFWYEGMTYYPIIKFWGIDDVAQVKAKKQTSSSFQYNRLREVVKPATTPCMLVGSKRGTITVAGSIPPELRKNADGVSTWINTFFSSFEGRVRQLSSPYIDKHEYGVSLPYAEINNNFMLFGLKAADQTANSAVTTYFGFKDNYVSTNYATITANNIEAYNTQDIASLASVVQETNVESAAVSPQLGV